METTQTIKIGSETSYATVSVFGAFIENLILDKTAILGRFTRGDGKSSATHPCTPIFGPETTTNFGLPQHGIGRTVEWNVIKQDANSVILELAVNVPNYPSGLVVQQIFSIVDNKFTLQTLQKNIGSGPLPTSFGEHFYWQAPNGYSDITLNNKPLVSFIEGCLATEVLPSNQLVIPGQPSIQLELENLPFVQCWTYNAPTEAIDTQYVCIEPCETPPKSNYFGSEKSLIQPGTSKENKITIALLTK